MTQGFFGERGNEGGGKRDADKRKRKKKTFPACPAPSSSLSGENEGLWKCIKCKERRETDRQGGGGGGEDGGRRRRRRERCYWLSVFTSSVIEIFLSQSKK